MPTRVFETDSPGSDAGATISMTVPSGANRILVVDVGIANGGSACTVTGITWNGVALTQLQTVNKNGVYVTLRSDIWYLINPAAGAFNLVFTFSTTSDRHVIASVYTDVDQVTPFGTPVTATGASSTAPTATAAAATGDLVIDSVSCATNTTMVAGAGQTERLQQGTGNFQHSNSEEAGAASVVMSWTLGASTDWATIAVALKQVTAPPTGTVVAPPPFAQFELTSDNSIPPIPPTPTISMWAVLYDSSNNPIGGLPQLLPGTTISEGCNKLGIVTLAVPRRSVGVNVATVTTQIGIWRSGEGEIFRGYITDRKRAVASDGTRIVTFEITDLGDELLRDNSWHGFRLDDVNYQTGLDSMFNQLSGWSVIATGVFPNLTKSFDNQNFVEILNEVANIGNAFWRIRPTTRVIEIIQTPDDSGMVLANLQQGSVDSEIGIIASLDEASENANELFNFIAPESKADGDVLLTLKDSSRTTPYTIQERVVTPPGIVDIQGSGGSTTANPLQIPILSMGDNRVIIMVVRYGQVASHALTGISVGGRPMINTFTGIGGPEGDGHYQQGYGIKNPPKGDQAITMQATDPTDDIATWAVAISLRDTEQPFEALDIFAYQEVSGTGAANTPTALSIPNGSIVISVLSRERDDPAVPAAPYNLEYDEVLISPSGTGVGNRRFFVAMGLGSVFTGTSVQWAISNPGDRWLEATFVARPAKLYYIEDAASIATYGERKLPISLGTFIKLQNTSENIANAMYDFAVDYIGKHKDPTLFYNFSAVHLPLNPLEWSFGQTMRVIYRDADENIDADLVVTERTQEFDENGVRMWRITFSDKVQFRIDDRGVWFLDQLRARVAAIQINQT